MSVQVIVQNAKNGIIDHGHTEIIINGVGYSYGPYNEGGGATGDGVMMKYEGDDRVKDWLQKISSSKEGNGMSVFTLALTSAQEAALVRELERNMIPYTSTLQKEIRDMEGTAYTYAPGDPRSDYEVWWTNCNTVWPSRPRCRELSGSM